MDEVSVFDAKNRLSALLDRVEHGDSITITRRGKPVAQLVPMQPSRCTSEEIVEASRKLRQHMADRGESFTWDELKAWRDEGRR